MRVALACVLLILIHNNPVEAADRQPLSLAGSVYDDEVPAYGPIAPVTPSSRQRPVDVDPYAPLGIAVGSMVAFPAVALGAIVTDNVEQSMNRATAAGVRVAPRLGLESEWPRHRFRLAAAGEAAFYPEQSGYGEIVGRTDGSLRLDIRRGTEAEFTFTASRTDVPAGFDEVPGEAERGRIDRSVDGGVELTHAPGLLRLYAKAAAERQLFGDVALSAGGSEDNGDRDYAEYDQGVEAGYEGAGLRPFVGITARQRIHDAHRDRSGLERDSHGVGVHGGLALPPGDLWSGRVALSYDWMDYEDDALPDHSGPGVAVDLNWRPSLLTLVSFRLASDFAESAAAGTSGYRTHSLDVAARHEVRENLTIDGELETEWAQSIGPGDDSRSWRLRLAATYKFNRMLGWSTVYEFATERSGGETYAENRLTTGLEITP
jgi:hypothetical protein